MTRKPGSAGFATETLRERILDGTYAPGDRMPSATAIADEFGIDRGTASRVIAELRNAGLILTKPRSASYVRTFEPIQRSFPGRLAVWQTGQAIQDADSNKSPQSVEVTVGETAATESVASAFGVEVGEPVVHRSRRFVSKERPFQLADSYYLRELAHGTRIVYTDTGPGGVYARLAEIGHAPVRFVERLRARMPLPSESKALELPGGTPVIAITRTAFDAADCCVEVTVMILDSSAYELEYRTEI